MRDIYTSGGATVSLMRSVPLPEAWNPLGLGKGHPMMYVNSVQTARPVRRQGHARCAITAMCQDADTEGIALWLAAEPDEDSISLEALCNFYRSVGFQDTGLEPRGFMVRVPRYTS